MSAVVRSIGGVFCDDVRQEVTGKLTLVGCYTDSMVVPRFPATIPRLCVLARIITPATEPFNEVKVRILQDDETLVDVDIPAGDYEVEVKAPQEEGAMHVLHAQFALGPLEFTKASALRVRAMLDGKEVRGLAIRVIDRSSLSPPKVSGGQTKNRKLKKPVRRRAQ